MKHYLYGGSGAARLLHCPASIELSKGIPNTSSPAALRGTCIHRMLERGLLEEDYKFASQLGTVCDETDLEIEQDHIDCAVEMYTKLTELMAEYSYDEYDAETTGVYDDDIGSTVDVVFTGTLPDGRKMVCEVDFKTGMGVQVEAQGNPQLRHNAMCLRENSEVKDMFADAEVILGVIIQPNRAGVMEVKRDEFTPDDVTAWSDTYLDAVELADVGGQTPIPGKCAFCPAAPVCPARNGEALKALQMNPEHLETLGEAMAMVASLNAWTKTVERTVFEQLEAGAPVTGFKLVAKQARETWKDPIAALKALRLKAGGTKYIADTKIKSPAQVRKVLKTRGKKDIDFLDEGLTSKESSGSTIAAEDDKRAAVLSAVAFGDALKRVS